MDVLVQSAARVPVGPATAPVPPVTDPAQVPPRRAGGGVILLPPWRRAPWLPFRQPAVILAVLGATAILACASASAVLFLSSASSESLRRIVAAGCPDAAQVAVTAERVGVTPSPAGPASGEVRSVDGTRVRSALTDRGLPDPRRVGVSAQTPIVQNAVAGQAARLFHADGAAAQITSLTGPATGRGIWLPYGQATRMAARPGDTVRLYLDADRPAPVRVVGVYRDLFDEPVRPFWCSYATLFQNPGYGSDNVPPPLLIATDEATFTDLRDAYGDTQLSVLEPP